MKVIKKAQEANDTINNYWKKGLIIFWVIAFAVLLGSGFDIFNSDDLPDRSVQGVTEEVSTSEDIPLISYKKCPVSSTNQAIDNSPLKTNTEIGKFDIVEDTDLGGVNKNQIPAITNPKFLSINEASDCILPTEEVIVVNNRIYPKNILNLHQVVNDTLDQRKYIVTYSPYSDSYSAYITTDLFGVSGRLYAGNTLLFDYGSETLWQQLSGEAVIGDHTGGYLGKINLIRTNFESAVEEFPNAQVLSYETGFVNDYSVDPYVEFHNSDQIIGDVKSTNTTLDKKEKIISVTIDGVIKGYTLKSLENADLLDLVNDKQITIQLNTKLNNYEIIEKDSSIPLISTESYLYSWEQIYPEGRIYYNEY